MFRLNNNTIIFTKSTVGSFPPLFPFLIFFFSFSFAYYYDYVTHQPTMFSLKWPQNILPSLEIMLWGYIIIVAGNMSIFLIINACGRRWKQSLFPLLLCFLQTCVRTDVNMYYFSMSTATSWHKLHKMKWYNNKYDIQMG